MILSNLAFPNVKNPRDSYQILGKEIINITAFFFDYIFLSRSLSLSGIELLVVTIQSLVLWQGRMQRFWKGRALYVGNHGWPAKKTLGFRWSKKAEITLETTSFWQNISISIFKFSPFLLIKSYQFFKIY